MQQYNIIDSRDEKVRGAVWLSTDEYQNLDVLLSNSPFLRIEIVKAKEPIRFYDEGGAKISLVPTKE